MNVCTTGRSLLRSLTRHEWSSANAAFPLGDGRGASVGFQGCLDLRTADAREKVGTLLVQRTLAKRAGGLPRPLWWGGR